VPAAARQLRAGRAVHLAAERDQERERADQVRRARVHQDRPLARGLPRDADVAVREVAQAAVRELRGPAARALREVAALDERDAEPAGGGIERAPRADDPAADDEHVDRRAVRELRQLPRTPRRVERVRRGRRRNGTLTTK
jgi:hypothetical protein